MDNFHFHNIKAPGTSVPGAFIEVRFILLVVDRVHVLDELDSLVGVTDLVNVPGNDLDEAKSVAPQYFSDIQIVN